MYNSILNKIMLIHTNMFINIPYRDSIWLTNFINHCNKIDIFVFLLITHIEYNNFITNIINKDLFKIIFCYDDKDVKNELENIYKKYIDNIDNIIIISNLFFSIIDESWFLLDKIIIYGTDNYIDNIKILNNKFKELWVQSHKIKQLYVLNDININKIIIKPALVFKYDFIIPERTDSLIKLIYVGTLCENQNILQIIEQFIIIHNERPEIVLTIIYGNIEGTKKYVEKINKIIKEGIDGITFIYNLSHRETCFHIATSDIGICWKKNDFDNISLKKKEYIAYNIIVFYKLVLHKINFLLKFGLKKIFKSQTEKYNFVTKIINYPDVLVLKKPKYSISGMFDEFTKTSFENYFDIIDFDIENNYDELKIKFLNIKFFFIETCWNFKNISLAYYKAIRSDIFIRTLNLLDNIKKISIELNFKIIIWNKEDPVNYNFFSYLVNYSDYYFTSDINIIDKYKLDFNKNVNCMGFFLDPYIHNPIGNNDTFESCFAGRVYPEFKNRFEDSNLLLNACLDNNLDLIIFDREPKKKKKSSFSHYNEFKNYIYGRLNYTKLLLVYKYFKIIINLNTVQNSNTMFARRIYEIIGIKKNIISNYSDGVKNNFENIFIYQNNPDELNKFINFIDSEPILNEYNKHKQWRNINLSSSFASNINNMLSKCNFDNLEELKLKTIFDLKILIFFLFDKIEINLETIIKFTNNYKIIYVKNHDEINDNKYLFDNYEYIVFLSHNNCYDMYYIIDNLLLIEYSYLNIISKPTNIVLEYQIKKNNQTELFNTIIKTNIQFKIKKQLMIFDNHEDILYSDRFGFIKNLNKLNNFQLEGYKILYNNPCILEIDVLEENNYIYFDGKKNKLKKGINQIKLTDIENKYFYFFNNSSIDFIKC